MRHRRGIESFNEPERLCLQIVETGEKTWRVIGKAVHVIAQARDLEQSLGEEADYTSRTGTRLRRRKLDHGGPAG